MNKIESLDDAFAAIVKRQQEVQAAKAIRRNCEWDRLLPLAGRVHMLIPELKGGNPYLDGADRWRTRSHIDGKYGSVFVDICSADPSNVTIYRSRNSQQELHLVVNPFKDPERFILAVAERIQICSASEIVTL